jgi:hypothetical protein
MSALIGFLGAHVAAGTLGTSAALHLRHLLPRGFLRFVVGAALLLALLSCISARGYALAGRFALVASAAGWYLTLSRGRPRPQVDRGESAGVALAAGLSSVAALALECLAGYASSSPTLWAVGSAMSSGAILGSVSVSMVLGHWYLVDPRLSIAPLREGALGFAAAAALRAVAVGGSVMGEGGAALRIERPADLVYSTPALFFLMRALTGLGGPLVLAGLIWQTVRMRSTQSATGLLYVAVILVLFGELVSQFLTVTTGFPL